MIHRARRSKGAPIRSGGTMRQEGEPSVEEILESIKKVIARDNRDALQVERNRRAAVVPPPVQQVTADEDAILDLGEAGARFEDEDDDAAFDERFEDDEESAGLTNHSAADAMRQSLAALAMLSEPSQPPQIVRSGETSLEGLVREMLRPMLAQWLDTHLPDMVERLVKAEIARIAGKQR